jgi:hypothetical protein
MSKTTLTLTTQEIEMLLPLINKLNRDIYAAQRDFIENGNDMPHRLWQEKDDEYQSQIAISWKLINKLSEAETRSIAK